MKEKMINDAVTNFSKVFLFEAVLQKNWDFVISAFKIYERMHRNQENTEKYHGHIDLIFSLFSL